jgi:hypothetical protein
MKSFADAEQKLEIICAVLNDPNCDQRYRRLIEKESTQVVRILETSLIVRELYREFEGSLLAVRQLRLHSDSRSPVSLSAIPIAIPREEGDKDDDDAAADGEGDGGSLCALMKISRRDSFTSALSSRSTSIWSWRIVKRSRRRKSNRNNRKRMERKEKRRNPSELRREKRKGQRRGRYSIASHQSS